MTMVEKASTKRGLQTSDTSSGTVLCRGDVRRPAPQLFRFLIAVSVPRVARPCAMPGQCYATRFSERSSSATKTRASVIQGKRSDAPGR